MWGAPGPAFHPHGLGQHPRQTPGTRRAPCGRPRRSSIARFGGGISACHHHQERHARPAVTARRSGAARSACAARLHTLWPRAMPGATRSSVALGLFPAGPSSSTLAPSPLKGRVCGSCPELEPVNAGQLRRTNQLRVVPAGGQLAGTGFTSPRSARLRLRLTGRGECAAAATPTMGGRSVGLGTWCDPALVARVGRARRRLVSNPAAPVAPTRQRRRPNPNLQVWNGTATCSQVAR
jgi:hypothetical protein